MKERENEALDMNETKTKVMRVIKASKGIVISNLTQMLK